MAEIRSEDESEEPTERMMTYEEWVKFRARHCRHRADDIDTEEES
jgi:hypothetical protein